MSSPIVHGTALCPLLRFPTGAPLALRVIMDEAVDLDAHSVSFIARSSYGQTRALFRVSEGDALTKEGQTVDLTLSPASVDETEDSDMTFAELQRDGKNAFRIDFRDADEDLVLRLQGDIEWLPEEGSWEDEPTSLVALPEITVDISAGAVSVTVALITAGGSTIADIEGLQAALDAKASTSAVAAALATKADASAVTALSESLGDAATKSVGTTSGTVAAGDDARIAGALQDADGVRLDEIEDTYDDAGTVWHTLSLSVTKVAAALYSAVFRIKIGGIPFLRVLVDKIIHLHHSWTDETNYSRCEVYWDDDRGVLMFKQVAAGTGVVKGFQFEHNGDKFLNLGPGGMTYSTTVNFQYIAKFGGLLEIGKWGTTPGNEYLSSGCYLVCDQPGGTGTPHRLIAVFPEGAAQVIATEPT